MSKQISVENGLRIAMRHPRAGAPILAKTLASVLNDQKWITKELKFKLCAMFVENLIDGGVEKSVDHDILEKIKRKPFPEALKIMRKRPETGLKYMIAIIMEELRNRQRLDLEGQSAFYEELLASFFPEIKVDDVMNK
jgi:hypothetical protein